MTNDLDALKALYERATKGVWYLLETPWLPRGSETTILAGSPDPHAAKFVCDFENFGEDEDSEKNGWNDAELIVALHNAFPALLARLEAAERDAERYRWWRENVDCIAEDGDGIFGVAYSWQIPLFGLDKSVANEQTSGDLMDAIADRAILIDAAKVKP